MKKKYIISWDSGYGRTYEEIEVDNEDEARKAAYEAWREECENQADYDVVGEATDELREQYL